MLVVAHHIAIVISGNGGMPFYLLNYPHDTLSTYFFISLTTLNQAFFMSLFFFISGYVIPQALMKYGTYEFIKTRMLRLGIPLLVYYFLLAGLLNLGVNFWHHQPLEWTFNLGPLWFIELLLIFSLVYVLLSKATPKSTISISLTKANFIKLSAFIALFLFLIRIIYPMNKTVFNINIAELPIYIFYFSAGIIAAKQDWLNKLEKSYLRLGIVLSLISIFILGVVVYLALTNRIPIPLFNGGFNLYSLFWCFWEVTFCLGASISLLYLFKTYGAGHNQYLSNLTASSYTVYLLQFYFIFAVMLLLSRLTWNSVLVWLVASILTNVMGFLLSSYLRQLPLLNKVL